MQQLFQEFSDQVKALLWPKDYFAWQTLLLLSLFSLVVATAVDSLGTGNPFVVDALINLSWVFFTSAIWWALAQNPIKVGNFSISPWVTGIVLCLFLFRPWREPRISWAISSWPLISTAIMALPYFIDWELKFKQPKGAAQQRLVMTALINMLLSSWIVFNFRVQDWVVSYPSLLVSDVGQSAFVYDFALDSRDRQPLGVPLLLNTTDAIAAELTDQPWYQTERWLYTRQGRLEAISTRMLENLSAPDERTFWRMEVPEPRRLGDGYLLSLRAIWTGPVSRGQGFFVEKTCKILPVDRPRSTPSPPDRPPQIAQITQVDCGTETPAVQWIEVEQPAS